MLNPLLSDLPDYAFPRLRALIADLTPGLDAIDMTIGEPRHGAPRFVTDILSRNPEEYGKYPPIGGTGNWLDAASAWLMRRYDLAPGVFDKNRHLLPLNGTREGLFSLAFVTIPPAKNGKKPAVLMPNPFYQCYTAAAVSAGADPIYLSATRETGFLPDIDAVDGETLARTALVYLCTPANPQGSVADMDYLKRLIFLARAHDFTLAVDECYSEIYGDTPPVGALQACASLVAEGKGDASNPFDRVVVFHSLSKRSSLPGLRSGLVAGDPEVIAAFRRFRSYVGPASPIPVYEAAAAAWSDEQHVTENRRLYREKFDCAERILAGKFGFYRPAGGFFLWLDVGDGEAATRKLWQDVGVKVLPGAYLSQTDHKGFNPGTPYIRVALVNDLKSTETGLTRLADCLGPKI